jgi:hypothetical protein
LRRWGALFNSYKYPGILGLSFDLKLAEPQRF